MTKKELQADLIAALNKIDELKELIFNLQQSKKELFENIRQLQADKDGLMSEKIQQAHYGIYNSEKTEPEQ